MSRACPEFEPILIDLAAGDVAPADRARLEAHLPACAACRAEAQLYGQVVSLASLPPATPAEREAVARGAGDALHRHRDRRRVRAAGMLLAVAASVAIAIGVPRLARSPGPDPVAARPPAAVHGAAAVDSAARDAAAPGWEVPDLDAAWAASAVADPDAVLDGDPATEPEMLFAEVLEVNDER